MNARDVFISNANIGLNVLGIHELARDQQANRKINHVLTYIDG